MGVEKQRIEEIEVEEAVCSYLRPRLKIVT
jgi:hypothetical protein